MKKMRLIVSLALLAFAFMVFAQNDEKKTTGGKINYGSQQDESKDNQKSSQEQSLYKITVDTFERSGEWRASMPIEYGLVNIKELPGAPLELANKKAEKVQVPPKYGMAGSGAKTYFEEEMDEHKLVLGIKVSFMSRGYSWVRIDAPNPIKLEGMVKGFEAWVCGRNKRHTLYLALRDFYGEQRFLEVGSLNFVGWKAMNVQVPYTITQEDFRFSVNRGLTLEGFVVMFHPEETWGKFYIYFDNLSAEISRFLEENRDTDDLLDTW